MTVTTTSPLRPVPATAVRTFGPRQRTSAARVRARATWPDLRGLHIATVRGTTFVSWTAGPPLRCCWRRCSPAQSSGGAE